MIANCLQGCAELAAAAGDLERAARLSGTSLAIFDEIGIRLVGETEDDYLALRATLVAGLGEQRVDELEAEGRAAPRDEAVAAGPCRPRHRWLVPVARRGRRVVDDEELRRKRPA